MNRMVFMLEGAQSGEFVTLPETEAAEAIAKGLAQDSLEHAHNIRTPKYATREMRSEGPANLSVVQGTAEKTQTTELQAPEPEAQAAPVADDKPKRRRGRPPKNRGPQQ